MHELSLATALVDQVQGILEREGALSVTVVRLSIGALSGVEREAFAFCFPLAARDTPLQGATLDFEEVAAEVLCRACGRTSHPEFPVIRCDHCGGPDVDIVAGRDFVLKSLEVR